MKVSINPNTRVSYKIPENDDLENIMNFLKKNRGKKIVAVQGLGFVGSVMSLICANALTKEYAVIGVDLLSESSYWKIRSINDGVFPVVADDPQITQFFNKAYNKGNFIATYDTKAYNFADVIIVDINLDVQKDSNEKGFLNKFEVNLENFKAGIRSIGTNCKDDVLILVETTVPPGTCEKVIKPIIEEELKKRLLTIKNYRLSHSYERVMPGPEYINSIREFPRVYAGINKQSADAAEEFLNTIIDVSKCKLTRLENTNATEMAKVLENSYRSLNIAFVVEWSRFAEEAGVDLYTVINAIRVRSTHANLMYPGVGVGGYCLTKDPLLASWSRKSFFGSEIGLELSTKGVSINDQMPVFAYTRLINVFGPLKDKKVAFLGISYRGDVGDTRFTPVELLVKMVLKEEAEIILHDPFVLYWEEQKRVVQGDIDVILSSRPDVIIFSAGHTQYKNSNFITKILKSKSTFIFDTIGLLNSEQIALLQDKHIVSVLGRGDL